MYIRNMTLKYYSVTEKILRLSIIYIKQAPLKKKKPNQNNNKKKSAPLASLTDAWSRVCLLKNDQDPQRGQWAGAVL